MLIAVKEKIANNIPTGFMVDFGKTLMNAIQKKTFTDPNLSGYHFHPSQCFVRKINEVGLKLVYEQNPGLCISLPMVPVLAFLSLAEIEPAFDLLSEELVAKLDFCNWRKM